MKTHIKISSMCPSLMLFKLYMLLSNNAKNKMIRKYSDIKYF